MKTEIKDIHEVLSRTTSDMKTMKCEIIVTGTAFEIKQYKSQLLKFIKDPRPNIHCFYYGGKGCMNQRLGVD